MSLFRDPYYLDKQKLVPFASHHDVPVASDISVTIRDLGQRKGSASLGIKAPGFHLDAGGEKGTEQEVTRSTATKGHPVSALNTLLNQLANDEEGGLLQDIPEPARKRTHLEADRHWEVSPATELGGILSKLFRAFSENPTAMQGGDVPMELMGELLDPSAPKESVVLQSTEVDQHGRHVLLLLDAGNLLPGFDLHDLEDDLTVFGQIDSVVGRGDNYSLERFLLSGINRTMRRMVNVGDLLNSFSSVPGLALDPKDIHVDGPAVVIRPIAIY